MDISCISIDSKIAQFEKHKEKYPNIVAVWTQYLTLQKKYFNSILDNSEAALNSIHSLKNDIPMESIYLLKCVINQPKDIT